MKNGKVSTATEATKVTFKALSEKDIREYVSTHQVLDKAGAYAVQDGVLVKGYSGSYTNIVGLPLEKLSQLTGFENTYPSENKCN